MFFVLSKTLGYLLLPTNFLIAIGFVGAILMLTRFASFGRKLVIAAVLLLVICGLSPLGKALLYPLEARFPPWDAARGAPDGIIVLGASIESLSPPLWRGDIRTRAWFFPSAARTSSRTMHEKPISRAPSSKASVSTNRG